ncbi:MAG: PilN domain-containing protein [Woeseia sp.]|nr:PilN domain-containing protein [Woeseia sp.]MBT8096086.1 PilN domain-containing protein [Woeseia sp.]NNE60718.1 PilN domain-containing protein [Woeseia sp.]NNL54720.1 PilN domain-containing protein [Woeseia sp.]
MPTINLLPWREAERKRRQRDFFIATGIAFVAGIAGVILTILVYNQRIDYQDQRNARLEAEIVDLERSISEIDGLERQKERLLARMEIIERLQGSRPEIVHLFDELSRQMPEGVYLTELTQEGPNVRLSGVAQSSTRVSALMRRIDSSEWLSDPSVVKVETTEFGPGRQARFIVTFKQVDMTNDDMEDAG